MRLIDAEKLEGEAVCLYTYGGARYIPLDALKRAPTVELPRWIPVTERLPEKHGGVYACLVKFPESESTYPFILSWHQFGSNGYVDGPHFSHDGCDGAKVTHWMPLPKPPKEG